MDKRGVLGLGLVTAAILGILIIAVIGIVFLLTMSQMQTVAESVITPGTGNVRNETITSVTAVGKNLAAVINQDCVAAVITVTNATNANSSNIIPASNYTVSGCRIIGRGGWWNNTNWNVTYSYSYLGNTNPRSLVSNASSGMLEFFNNTPTIFTLLGIVVIILIIGMVVLVVSRFGGGGRQVGISTLE